MKTIKEWLYENHPEMLEFFGMFKNRDFAGSNISAADMQGTLDRARTLQNKAKKQCPFCKAQTVENRLDSSYYPTTVTVWQCAKCFRYWDNSQSSQSDELNPQDAKEAKSLIQ